MWRLLVQRVQGHGGVASDGARQLERLLDSGAMEEQNVGVVTATVLHSLDRDGDNIFEAYKDCD